MATIHILNKENSILNDYLREIRDVKIQNDPLRFQKNMERIGAVVGLEISKCLSYKETEITTPLANCKVNTLDHQPVLTTILRAGLSMHLGLQYIFDRAPSAFISAYRKPHENREVDIEVEYQAAPSLENRTLILSDPMLATGSSLHACYVALLKNGSPKETHVAVAIASEEGLKYVEKHFPDNTHFWLAAVDPTLNEKSYIVPGLGDAGDLAYGPKTLKLVLSSIIKALALAGLASVKLFYTAPLILAAGYSDLEAFAILSIGGVFGILVFYFFGGWLTIEIGKFLGKIFGVRQKKTFTKSKRFIVKIKQRFGIIGIAFVTPVILSIPIGSIIAYSYYRHQSQTLPYLILSAVIWSGIAVYFWGVFF